jgi:toxin-antitoxin system, toxin component, relE family
MKVIQVLLLEDARKFLKSLPQEVSGKIYANLSKVQNRVLDKNIFKKLTGTDFWEFRTHYSGQCYRLIAFWDKTKKSLVVCTHGFIKKVQKTPKNEIDKATSIRHNYERS